jgi:hypothetical protein
MLKKELALQKSVNEINNIISKPTKPLVDIRPLVLRFCAPHPHHALAAAVAGLQWPWAHVLKDWARAAAELKKIIECRDTVLPFPSRDTSFNWERLGDALAADGRLQEAQAAYRRAVRGLMLVMGPAHHCAGVAATKLAAVQARMQTGTQVAPGMCSLCGEGRLDGKALARCGRCSKACYCCQEHQRAHWVVHKKSCAPAV